MSNSVPDQDTFDPVTLEIFWSRLISIADVPTEPAPTSGGWFPSREKVVLHWPELDRLLVEELE